MEFLVNCKFQHIPLFEDEIVRSGGLLCGSKPLKWKQPGKNTWRGEFSWSRTGWWGVLVVLLLSNAGLVLERYKSPRRIHDCAGDSTGYAPWCKPPSFHLLRLPVEAHHLFSSSRSPAVH
jgi:hypothetical protein